MRKHVEWARCSRRLSPAGSVIYMGPGEHVRQASVLMSRDGGGWGGEGGGGGS